MQSSFYDQKIIILDLNFRDLRQYETDENLYTKKLLSELSAHQNLIIATDNPYFLAQKIIDDLDLKSGYLISDSGSVISNIASKKIIDSGTLDSETVKKICYKCIWDGLYFSIITETQKYPFNINYWLLKKYESDLTHLTQYKKYSINTSSELDDIIKSNTIKRIEIYFLDNNTNIRCRKMIKFASIFNKEIDFSINLSFLNIIPKGKTRESAVKHILSKLDFDLTTEENGIYCAINQCNCNLASSSYFSIITHEAKDQQKHEDLELIQNAELIPVGNVSWVDWFYNQEHLWIGNPDSSLQKFIDKYDAVSFSKANINDILNRKIKYLNIGMNGSNSLIKQNKMRLNCWPEQIFQAVKLINKKQSIKERI